MWKTVYIATNDRIAQKIAGHLTAEGIMVKTNCLGSLPKETPHIEILVLAGETEDALEILNGCLGSTLTEQNGKIVEISN